jgi:hypothetical protein
MVSAALLYAQCTSTSLMRILCRCNAYNTAMAASCLLAVAFAFSIFFDIKDLHASRTSPRTRT